MLSRPRCRTAGANEEGGVKKASLSLVSSSLCTVLILLEEGIESLQTTEKNRK